MEFLPLYPISLIIATDLEILGNLDSHDTQLATGIITDKGSINLGPFNIASIESDGTNKTDVLKNNGYFVLAWISELIDVSPKS